MGNWSENNARGTIIAFSPKIHPIVHYNIVDDQRRSIILDCKICNHHSTLVNINGPNTDASAYFFVESTFKELGKLIPRKTKLLQRTLMWYQMQTMIHLEAMQKCTRCSEIF